MRIVHVNTESTWRGGESQVYNLMRGLRDRGHDVEAVAQPGGALSLRCREASIPLLELPMRGDLDLASARRLARRLRAAPCDVLHAQTARAHSIGLLAKALGAPGLLVVSRRLDFPVGRGPLSRWKYRSRRVTAYVAVAGVVRDVLIAGGVEPSRVTVVNSSIDLGRFEGVEDQRDRVRAELGLPGDVLIVGNVAALAWHKGQKDLLAAFPHVLESRPEARLVLVGEGDQRESLQAQVRRLGLAERVVLTGARADVPRLLSAFDLFCMPSYFEGLCNSVLEAFAVRVPVVATRAGGLPEIVADGGTGLLVPPHDPPALASALLRLAADAPLRARLVESAHRLVRERFGADTMVERTIDLYRHLLDGGAPEPARPA